MSHCARSPNLPLDRLAFVWFPVDATAMLYGFLLYVPHLLLIIQNRWRQTRKAGLFFELLSLFPSRIFSGVFTSVLLPCRCLRDRSPSPPMSHSQRMCNVRIPPLMAEFLSGVRKRRASPELFVKIRLNNSLYVALFFYIVENFTLSTSIRLDLLCM